MRTTETYEHIQIPESYGLYASDIAQIESICKKRTPDGNIYAFDLISLAFKVGFGLGKQYETDKRECKELKKLMEIERLFKGQ